mmetsp:Transcript_7664/g.999  ORF Transcript_7664/g.999 Transcript_7664/m.999 type:complete len:147 (+) Transcript_7664:169-609(+)
MPDYKYKEHMTLFSKLDEVKQYFQDYMNDFQINHLFNYNQDVLKTEYQENGQWKVTLRSGEIKHYDFLVISTGSFCKPYKPTFPNQDKFKGKYIHNSEFVNAKEFIKGKRVAVVGGNKGAADIVTTSYEYEAAEIFAIIRTGNYHV